MTQSPKLTIATAAGISQTEAWQNVHSNFKAARYPSRDDARVREGLVFPKLSPKFDLSGVRKVFTIGSCFARAIEDKLEQAFDLPVRRFRPPEDERDDEGRLDNILNEYNPGTMAQRIGFALSGGDYPLDVLAENADGVWDHAMHSVKGLSRERALERKADVARIYHELTECEVVILTLGLVEAWFDTKCGLYLNRMPIPEAQRADPERFQFRVLDVATVMSLLEPAVRALSDRGKRVLLSVSPVPLQTTFTGQDCATANAYSKAVLRVCAQELARISGNVDYYPSYEIITSGGSAVMKDDLVHLPPAVVDRVTDYMLSAYLPQPAETAMESPGA